MFRSCETAIGGGANWYSLTLMQLVARWFALTVVSMIVLIPMHAAAHGLTTNTLTGSTLNVTNALTSGVAQQFWRALWQP